MSLRPPTILVLAGTREGRFLAKTLYDRGYPVIASVVSDHGANLLTAESTVPLLVGKLDEKGFQELLEVQDVGLIIDATHPYAAEISRLAQRLGAEKNVPCLRYQRPATSWPEYAGLYFVESYQEATEKAGALGNVWFLAVGSKNLDIFVNKAGMVGTKIYARVLGVASSLQHCEDIGLPPEQVRAGHGPFSKEENEKMLRETGAQVLVTKDSGETGGTMEKVEAAMALGIPVIVIKRPTLEKGLENLDELMGKVEQLWNRQ